MDDTKDTINLSGDALVKSDADVESTHQKQPVGTITHPEIMATLNDLLKNTEFGVQKSVKRNVKALKKLQLQHINLEAKFFEELYELEMKYAEKFEPLLEKRSHIVNGTVIPTDEECDYPSDSDDEAETSNKSKETKRADAAATKTNTDEGTKGIPEFWLTAFQNSSILSDMIEECDEPILKHLTDVKAVSVKDPMSFYLEFHFEPNEYFTNPILKKFYKQRCAPDPTDAFAFDGPEIVKCTGCTIDWGKGKNITVKTVRKKLRHRVRAATKTVTKTVQNDSFFNFFNPPEVPEDEEQDVDEETQDILDDDYEVGNMLKDKIIPRAVLYFTGENTTDDESWSASPSSSSSSSKEDEDSESDENNISVSSRRRGKQSQFSY